MDKYSLSIIVVNYNTGSLLYKCLDSIQKSIKDIKYEIFVVDNNSSDDSWKAAEKFANCTLIRNKNNMGFCPANNQALKMVQSDFILLLNPDTELTMDAIEKMLEYLQDNSEIGIIGPKVLYPNGRPQYSTWSFPTLFTTFLGIFFLNKLSPKIFDRDLDNPKIREVDVVSGCCLLLRRKVYDEIGGLDENLFFKDDTDFCRRAKKKGWRIIYFPQSTIYHYGGMSSKGNRHVPVYFRHKSKIKYFKKHHTKKEVIVLRIIFLLEALFRIPVESIAYLITKRQENKTRLKAYFNIVKLILLSKQS